MVIGKRNKINKRKNDRRLNIFKTLMATRGARVSVEHIVIQHAKGTTWSSHKGTIQPIKLKKWLIIYINKMVKP
ncbi:DUF6680 family protein [Legionella drancourtii]